MRSSFGEVKSFLRSPVNLAKRRIQRDTSGFRTERANAASFADLSATCGFCRAPRGLCFLERARAACCCGHCHNLARDFPNIWTSRSALRLCWPERSVLESPYGLNGVPVLVSCCAPSGNLDAIEQFSVPTKPRVADLQDSSNLRSGHERGNEKTALLVRGRVHSDLLFYLRTTSQGRNGLGPT